MSTNEAESPLDPDEPHTPAWFTFLGIGLFLLGGIFLLAAQDDEEVAVVEPAVEPAAAQDDAPAVPAGNNPADPHAGHGH